MEKPIVISSENLAYRRGRKSIVKHILLAHPHHDGKSFAEVKIKYDGNNFFVDVDTEPGYYLTVKLNGKKHEISA